MNQQELFDKFVGFATAQYTKHSNDPGYDITPMVSLWFDGEEHIGAIMTDGNPLDAVAWAIKQKKPDMMGFVTPIWRKSPEGERIGEGILIICDTPLERLCTIFDVSRTPFALTREDSAEVLETRVPLLYIPTPKTEH